MFEPDYNYLAEKYPPETIDKEEFVDITETFQNPMIRIHIVCPLHCLPSYNLAKWLAENRPYYDVVKEKSFEELELYIRYLINHG